MAAPAPSPSLRRRLARVLRWIVLGIIGLSAVVYAARGPLLSRPLAHLAAAQLSRLLGVPCSVRAIGGDYVHLIELQEFRTLAPQLAGPVRSLSVHSVAVTYSLWALVRGQGLGAVRSLAVDGVSVDGDLTMPSPPAPPSAPAAGPDLAAILPYPLPIVSVTGEVHLALPLPDGRTGHLAIPSLRVLGGGTALSVDLSQLTLPELSIDQERWSARCEVASSRAMQVQSNGPLAGITIQSLSVVPERDGQRIDGEFSVAHGHLALSLDHEQIGARLAGVDAAQLPAWAGILAGHQLPGSGVFDGQLSMALQPAAVQESVDVKATGLVWRGLSPSAVQLRAERSGTHLTVDTLDFDNRREHLALQGLIIDLDREWPVAVPRQCDFHFADVGSLLEELRMPVPGICTTIPMVLDGTLTGHDLAVDHLRLTVHAGTSDLDIAGSAVVPVEAVWGRITLDGAWKAQLKAADFPCLGTDYQGMVQGDGLCSGSLLQPTADGNLSTQDLMIDGHRLGAVTISANAAYPRLTLKRFELLQGANHVLASASGDLSTQSLDHLEAQVDCADLATLGAGGSGEPLMKGSFAGTMVVGALHKEGLAAMLAHAQVSIQAKARVLEVAGVSIGDASIAASLHGGTLEVPEVAVDGPYQAHLAFSARVAADGASVVDCRTLDVGLRAEPLVHLRLEKPVHLTWTPGGRLGRSSLDDLELSALGGRISVHGALADTVQLSVHVYRLQPWELMPAWLTACCGMIDCTLAVSGDPRQPLITLHASTVGLRIVGRGAWFSLDARQTASGIVLDGLGAHIASCLDVQAVGQWPIAVGIDGLTSRPGLPRMRLFARAALIPGLIPDRPGLPVSGIASLSAGSDSGGARVDCSIRDMVLKLDTLSPDRSKALDQITSVEAHARAGMGGWTTNLTIHDTAGLSVDLAANGKAAFLPSQPWRFVPTLVAQPLTATLTLGNMQISRLRSFVPSLVHLSGLAAGQLHVTGHIMHPQWDGELQLDKLSLKTRTDIPAMTDGTGRVRIQGEKVTLEKLSLRMGYAPVTATGWVDLSGQQPVLDLKMVAENALIIQNQALRLRVDGTLALVGPISAMVLSGNLKITDALYSQPFELLSKLRPSGSKEPVPTQDQGIKLFSLRDEPLSGLAFNVDLRAVQSLHVRTDLFSGNASLDLHLGGTGLSPVPTGQIWVDDAKVRLPFSSLNLTHADMVFTKNNPFFPGIEAVGETRLKGYDLTLRVSGNYPNVIVTVESDPPLDNNDGLMLLTTGLTDQDRDQAGASRSQLTSVGEYLAKEIWGQVSAAPDPDAKPSILDLDRLDLSVGEELSITGAETITAAYQLSEHLYLRGDRDIFDDYNIMLVWRIRER